MNTADLLFQRTLRDILETGDSDADSDVRPRWADGTPAHTLKRFGVVHRYDLAREFPILTVKKVPFASCVDELLWIWQKKSNVVADLGSHIWDAWAQPDGTIGKAYGYQLGVKHRYPEGEFDQVERLLYDLKHNPRSRRMMTNLYVHADLHEMALYPCAHGLTFNVSGNRLGAVLHQRSQDMVVANGWNVCQYAVLVHMLAFVAGFAPGELLHVIADAHLYDRHILLAKEILTRTPKPAPAFAITAPPGTGFYDIKPEHLTLTGYVSYPGDGKIEVAV